MITHKEKIVKKLKPSDLFYSLLFLLPAIFCFTFFPLKANGADYGFSAYINQNCDNVSGINNYDTKTIEFLENDNYILISFTQVNGNFKPFYDSGSGWYSVNDAGYGISGVIVADNGEPDNGTHYSYLIPTQGLDNPFIFRMVLTNGTYGVYNLSGVSLNTGNDEPIGATSYNSSYDNYNLQTNGVGNNRIIVSGSLCRGTTLSSQDISNSYAEAFTPAFNACTYSSGSTYRVNQAVYNGNIGATNHYVSFSPNYTSSSIYCRYSSQIIEFTEFGEVPTGEQIYFYKNNTGNIQDGYYNVPFFYLPQVFDLPTDEVGVYQCQGEGNISPNCDNLTFIASSSVWSNNDINNYDGNGLLLGISGENVFPIPSPASTTYQTFVAFAKSDLFNTTFKSDSFNISWTNLGLENYFSDGIYDEQYWCEDPCYDIATTTLGGSIMCGLREVFCWAFTVSTSSKGYFDNSFNRLKRSFPMSTYFDLTDSLKEISTTTSDTMGFPLPIPSVGTDGKATITMEYLINSSTVKRVLGNANYSDIREAIIWVLWIIAGVYIIIRINHKHI